MTDLRYVSARAVYFVPADQEVRRGRFDAIGEALSSCEEFYRRHLGPFSRLSWRIERRPIIGQRPLSYYREKFGERVAGEVFGGYRFPRFGFSVVAIFVEGEALEKEGGSGSCGVFLGDKGYCIVSRTALKSDALDSVLFHELGHAIGLEHSEDGSVMGHGCWRGLSNTYLNRGHRAYILRTFLSERRVEFAIKQHA